MIFFDFKYTFCYSVPDRIYWLKESFPETLSFGCFKYYENKFWFYHTNWSVKCWKSYQLEPGHEYTRELDFYLLMLKDLSFLGKEEVTLTYEPLL